MYGGTCVDDVNGYQCACAPGYTGSNCQRRVDPCDSSPCLNDGRCTTTHRQSSYECSCQPGFTGRRCESFVDWCDAEQGHSRCQHGGTCVQNGNQYECLCQPGWEGLNCDIPSMSCAELAVSKGRSKMIM